MLICDKCGHKFPLDFYDENGKRHVLNKRKFCLRCSPLKPREKINSENCLYCAATKAS